MAPDLPPPLAGTGRVRLAAVLPAVATATSASLPVFLVGATAVQLMAALHIGPAGIGLLGALYSASGAAASIPLSRLTVRLGPTSVMAATNIAAALLIATVATAVSKAWELGAVLVLAGATSAAAQPAINVYLSGAIHHSRQGTAFGVKQSAVPTATLIAGSLVPLIVLRFGWRWGFGAAAIVAAALAVLPLRLAAAPTPSARPAKRPGARSSQSSTALALLAMAFGLGIAAASCLGTFLVPSGVAEGLPKAAAAAAAITASLASLGARLAMGMHADRSGGRHLAMVANMILLGAGGFLVLALSPALARGVFFAGAILSFGAGWGWNGLFNFAVVKYHPHSAAKATAITQAGGRLGGIAGPLAFGSIAATQGYTLAWAGCAAVAVGAAAMMRLGRRSLAAGLASQGPDDDAELSEELAFPS